MKKLIKDLFVICGLFVSLQVTAQHNVNVFAEFGSAVHAGEHTPMWQVSNRHGVSSLDNYAYLRGGAFYKDTVGHWRLNAGLDLYTGAGMSTAFYVQQAYADIRYRWIGLWAGARELPPELLNPDLSSGGLSWSGNCRPIPQVSIGIHDYIHLAPKVQFKARLSFGWFTDSRYQERNFREINSLSFYTRKIKYHHKSFFFRFGAPDGNWQFDMGMNLEDQFGGYKVGGYDSGDLGNGWMDYWRALIPQPGGEDTPVGEQIQFQGNLLGSEHLRLTYKNKKFSLSAYLENYFDDFSGMGKLNGMDGLWGIEYKSFNPQILSGFVIEYYQSVNQSGPLHGEDFTNAEKTGGADDYYNNAWYPGWTHWGMSIGNPLNVSPAYNTNGALSFLYNRIRAVHLGWSGELSKEWSYRAKMSFNRSWGTPFKPLLDIAENFSALAEFCYVPRNLKNWQFKASLAGDTGDLYGNNIGFQLGIKKTLSL